MRNSVNLLKCTPVIYTVFKSLMCTMIIVISSVRLSFSSHSLYDSPAMAEQASLGSAYLLTCTRARKETQKTKLQENQLYNYLVTVPSIMNEGVETHKNARYPHKCSLVEQNRVTKISNQISL